MEGARNSDRTRWCHRVCKTWWHGGPHTSRLTKFHETDNDEEERSEDDGIGNIQEELGNEDDENQESSDTENENQEPNDYEDNETAETNERKQNANEQPIKLKPGQTIHYTCEDTHVPISATVIGRAGKAQGPLKNWYNIQYTSPNTMEGTQVSIDLGNVTNLKIDPQPNATRTMDSLEEMSNNSENENTEPDVLMTEGIDMTEAKIREMESWKQNNVYEEIRDDGQKCISTRWVCSLKKTPQGIQPKARLVARGFEEYNEAMQKDSPTCASESLRVMLTILANQGWRLHSMDIKTAFLQGQELDRNIYLKPPKEAKCPGVIWKLKKCVYGLADASLHWYKRVKSVMISNGGLTSSIEPSMFYWRDPTTAKMIGVLACHVDDFIWGGTQAFEQTIEQIRSTFKVGKEEDTIFQYCGINLNQVQNSIYLNQNRYAENITRIHIDQERAREKENDLTNDEMTLLRSKIGQLLWLAHQSRPDILFDVTVLASNVTKSKIKDLFTANKLINKAKSQKLSLKFQPLNSENKCHLLVFSDAALGNLPDGGSQGGYIIFLAEKEGKCIPIWWNSKRIRRIVRSTLAAETLAMAEGVDMAIFIASLLKELGYSKQGVPIVCVTDCKSLQEAIKSNKCVSEKRLRMEIGSIKELFTSGQIQDIEWCNTKTQLADCLTKCGVNGSELLKTLHQGILDY